MTTRRRLLVGVDGSDDSLKAVKYAVREALADGSDLWLVYATDPVVIVNGYVWAVAATDDDLHRAGQARVVDVDLRWHHLPRAFLEGVEPLAFPLAVQFVR